jgi:SAM-dependent methyltransferase
MSPSAFDRVAHDYEEIHNRSLPPGVHSDEFVVLKAEKMAGWIGAPARGREFCYLDFGCGNGRLFRALADRAALRGPVGDGRLRLFGFDTSRESLAEARRIAGGDPVFLAADLNEFPPDVRFDLVSCCNVFHHIPPAERGAAAAALHRRMKPGGRLVIWEHNPFNPFTRLLVKICPFDEDARLVSLRRAVALFEGHAFRLLGRAYVLILPPKCRRLAPLAALEDRLGALPLGAQYWAMFRRNA